jgi:hypothetical protein
MTGKQPLHLQMRFRLTGLTALAGLMLFVAPTAVADQVTTTTERSRQLDVNPGETNPCNGSTGTVTDDEQDVFHITEFADGTYRFTGHSTVQVNFDPDDPSQPSYTGHETFMIAEAITTRTFTTTSRQRVRLRGTDGSFLTISELVHFSISASGVSVSFERPALVCS